MKRLALLTPLFVLLAQAAGDVTIPIEKYKLPNGLRVILSQDNAVPVVAVYMIFDVGARSEEKGRTGFAHLFEHMMFEGSANAAKGIHSKYIKSNGGTDNGSTHPDYTDYFETLPSNKLAVALWLESDRMRSLAINAENLTNQKEAVKQERRLSFDNRPYATAIVDKWPELTFGNWQSSHSLIGSFEDLNAASLEDVSKFFKTYYAPNNAVVVIVGDIQRAAAKKLVSDYFADIPSQPQPKRPDMTEPAKTAVRTETYKDPLAQVPGVVVGYPAPPRRSPDYYALGMVDVLLTGGESSRLQLDLVKGKQSVVQYEGNLGWPFADATDYKDPGDYSLFLLYKPTYKPADIVSQVQDEIAKIQNDGVDPKELDRARTLFRAQRIAGLQSALTRAMFLGKYEILDGDPGVINTEMAKFLAVTPAQIQAAAKKYLVAAKRDVLDIRPAPPAQPAKGGAMKKIGLALLVAGQLTLPAQKFDRTKPPETPAIPGYKLPPIYETKLPNGLSVVLAEDPRFPLVTVRVAFQAGSKFDPADVPGLSDGVATLLTQGTKTRTSRQIAEEAASIGGTLTGQSTSDSLILAGNCLSENEPKLLNLLADVVLNANFPAEEVALQKQNRKQVLLAQRSEANYLIREKFSEVIFGAHPYAHVGPTLAALDRMEEKDFAGFRDTYLTPNRAYLIAIGRLPARAEMMKAIQAQFGSWASKAAPSYSPATPPESKREIVLVDRPGSAQADVRVGRLSSGYDSPELFPLTLGSAILGGSADSRLFNDIREKRGYAYDAHTELDRRQEAGVFLAVTEVRNDVMEPALQALLDDLKEMAAAPVTSEELTGNKNYLSGRYLIRMEAQNGLADQLVTVKTMGLPNDYLETYTTRVRSVEPDQIEAVAKKYIVPENSAIVVVGDAAKIQKSLEKFGTVRVTKPE